MGASARRVVSGVRVALLTSATGALGDGCNMSLAPLTPLTPPPPPLLSPSRHLCPSLCPSVLLPLIELLHPSPLSFLLSPYLHPSLHLHHLSSIFCPSMRSIIFFFHLSSLTSFIFIFRFISSPFSIPGSIFHPSRCPSVRSNLYLSQSAPHVTFHPITSVSLPSVYPSSSSSPIVVLNLFRCSSRSPLTQSRLSNVLFIYFIYYYYYFHLSIYLFLRLCL